MMSSNLVTDSFSSCTSDINTPHEATSILTLVPTKIYQLVKSFSRLHLAPTSLTLVPYVDRLWSPPTVIRAFTRTDGMGGMRFNQTKGFFSWTEGTSFSSVVTSFSRLSDTIQPTFVFMRNLMHHLPDDHHPSVVTAIVDTRKVKYLFGIVGKC